MDMFIEPLTLIYEQRNFIITGLIIGSVIAFILMIARDIFNAIFNKQPDKPEKKYEPPEQYDGNSSSISSDRKQFLIWHLQPLRNNPKQELKRKVPICPKCGVPSLRVNWRGVIYAGLSSVGKTKYKLSTYETHMVDNKKVIAICLECGYNQDI